MTKEQKKQLVSDLVERFKEYPNFYIADTGGMTVSESNELRALCFESGISMTMIKNTLIHKALEQLEGDYSELYPLLKQASSVLFATEESPSVPAKVLKKYREGSELPVLKVACIETSVFVGDEQIAALAKLKSKQELVGDVIGLLQSPAKNVVSALKSSGSTIAGLIKTLSEREEA